MSFTNTIHVDYVDADKIVEGRISQLADKFILMADFSPSDKLIALLESNGCQWFVVDHHHTTGSLKETYPDKVWLENKICSTEQMCVLSDESRLAPFAEVIGIGDLFRDEDERFWMSREITVGLKRLFGYIHNLVSKDDAFNIIFDAYAIVAHNVSEDVTPPHIEDVWVDAQRLALAARLDAGYETLSTAQLIMQLELSVLESKGIQVGNVLFVDDLFVENMSSLAKMYFDRNKDIKLMVKIGKKGSISARASKHHDATVMDLNNDVISIKGHLAAGGGFNSILATQVGDKEALGRASAHFTVVE